MQRGLFLTVLLLSGVLAAGGSRCVEAQPIPGPEVLALEGLGHAVVTDGNLARLIIDPREALDARLELIRGAKHHILLSVPIWRLDGAGRRYLGEICSAIRRKKAADPGFKALVELDRVTFLPSQDWLGVVKSQLRKAGAQVRFFNPGTWIATPIYAARQHDKILIADGRRAIVGGRNVGNQYFDPGNHWTDLDLLFEGPAVQELQMYFLKNWVLMGHWNLLHNATRPQEVLYGEARSLWKTGYFRKVHPGKSPLERFFNSGFFPPRTASAGTSRALVLYDNPFVYDRAPTFDVLLYLLGKAQREVDLVTPYATLPRELVGAMKAAAGRGVRVRVVTSSEEHHDYGEKGWLATLEVLARLAIGGVSVYTWMPGGEEQRKPCANQGAAGTLLHAKFVRIDGEIGIVHSSNFNYRSTYYNTEAGVLLFDSRINARLKELVDELVGGRSSMDSPCDLRAAVPEDPAGLWRQFESRRNEVRELEDWSFMQ